MTLARVSRHNYRGEGHNALTLFGPYYIYRQSLGAGCTLKTSKKGQHGNETDFKERDACGVKEDQSFWSCWSKYGRAFHIHLVSSGKMYEV